MPKLNYLSIQNGDMMDITIGDYYPKLNNLDLSGNTGIAEIDVSGCPELEELHMSYTYGGKPEPRQKPTAALSVG